MESNKLEDLKDIIEKLKEDNIEKFIKRELTQILKTNGIDAKIYTRVKDTNKALEKMQRKGYTDIKQLTDLVGAKVVTSNNADIYKIKDIVESKYKVNETNDYISHPKDSGYKSLHMDIEIEGNKLELQVKTEGMDKAQSITHDILYKNNFSYINKDVELINKLSRKIYEHYSSVEKDFEYSKKNSLHDYIKEEKQKLIKDNNSIENQKKLIIAEENRLEKAKYFIGAIEKNKIELDKLTGIKKLLNKKAMKSYEKESDTLNQNLREMCNVKDLKDYEIQSAEFNEVKESFNKDFKYKENFNKEYINALENVDDAVRDIRHKEIKDIYKKTPNSQFWDKNITEGIDKLNSQTKSILSIEQIKEVSSSNDIAKEIIKGIEKIFRSFDKAR